MRGQKGIWNGLDGWLLLIYIVLVLMGWLNIYAAVYDETHASILDTSRNYGKQLIWIGTALVIALVILLIDSKFWESFSYVIYGFTLFTLVAVLLFGREVAGSRSWFEIGSFRLQPAEFAKFATALALGRYLAGFETKMEHMGTKMWSAVLIMAPAALILLQGDAGSSLVYAAFVLVLFREGLSGKFLILGVGVAVLFILALLIDKLILVGIFAGITLLLVWLVRKSKLEILVVIAGFLMSSAVVYSVDYVFDHVLAQHQKTRINVLLGKELDAKGAGYNVNQSKIAIGSGGLAGKGFKRGTQTKYNFVPEQSTDFIFCTVGEEWGFLGSFVVISLFLVMLLRILFIAERQRSRFSRVYGYGVAAILFFHFLVNIGMTIGLAPVIGIPMPFFSYGGSSLWGFTILLFIFIKLDSVRMEILG
ncbi:MAG: rod shape-determining protein RodA [Flavobacteriales bacterium]|nr:rod shape-determining protein RodA [Flavobacteriales bacterium]MCB9449166.1 rod shape-determining protein RodA [Flavobacteriales bacterium]